MNNFIIRGIVLFTALSATVPASAQWIYVISSSVPDTDYYIDLSTLRKDSDIRRVWLLEDFKKIGSMGESSSVIRREFDCNLERERAVSWILKEKPLGKGKIIFSQDNIGPWSSAAPNSVGERFMRIVCGQW